MTEIICTPADSKFAEQIQADLTQLPPETDAVIVLLSPQAVADDAVQAALVRAIDANQRVVPVLVSATPLPTLIEHLEPVDIIQGYDFDSLSARLSANPREMHMRVRTPEVKAANKRTAYVVAVFALIMFLAALYGVGVLGIQAPTEEFDAIETSVIETRNAIIDNLLPRTTDEALNFQATIDGAAPTTRPLLIMTATASAAGR